MYYFVNYSRNDISFILVRLRDIGPLLFQVVPVARLPAKNRLRDISSTLRVSTKYRQGKCPFI